ncbi:MAG: DUF2946 family protein [Lautropia sp.]
MDEQVLRAMRKWPDVPAVHGWLRLGRRGQWLLVDRGQPGFDEARDGAGSPITSPPIVEFIGRNYGHDERGAWFWQNGPQRVFVDLELAPLIARVLNEPPQQRLVLHTGELVERIDAAATDADGNLWLRTEHGPALLDDRDIGQLELDGDGDGDGDGDDNDNDNDNDNDGSSDGNDDGDRDRPLTLRLAGCDLAVTPVDAAGAEALGALFGFDPRPRR